MRAVLVSEFGGPEQLRLSEVADPVPGPGQVRVGVHAAGVNPVDVGNRADGSWAGLWVPCILGYDIAGVVESVGPGVAGAGCQRWRGAVPVAASRRTRDNGQRTRKLAALLARRALRPVVSHLLPLAEAAQSHRIVEGGHPGGKIVFTLDR